MSNNNICIVINALSARWGGGQSYLLNMLKYLREYESIKIYLITNSAELTDETFEGVKIIRPNLYLNNIIFRTIWERYRLPGLLKELNADVLFCPGGTVNTKPPGKCKVVTIFRNMLIFDEVGRKKFGFGYMRFRLKILRRATVKSFKRADLVIYISEYAKRVVESVTGGNGGMAVVIPHGLDARFRTRNKKKMQAFELASADDYFLYVSLVESYKSHIEVVQAYSIVCKKRNTAENLLLVGPDTSSYARRVKREIDRLGLNDKVIMTGKIDYSDMHSLYCNAKANIFASTCENCPNIVLECLGSGRPLFLSNRDPMPEFGGDGAVYFDPSNPEELANLLLKYVDDENWAKSIGERAFTRSKLYDWSITARKTYQAILKLDKGNTYENCTN